MSIWTDIASPIISIINKVVPDKAAAAAAVAQLNTMQLQGELADEMAQLQAVTTNQSDIDKIEAASTSIWVSGWRPYVGWVCGTALAVSTIISPLFTWISTVYGHPAQFPELNSPLLQSTLAGMLGLGHVMRTIEKVKGVA